MTIEQAITFTPAELGGWIIGICAAIVTISGAVTAIIKFVERAKKPERDQDERIGDLEKRVTRHDELFMNDNRRLETIENGNRVTQKAILALLDHGLDGNNSEQMRQAKEELQNHLIER